LLCKMNQLPCSRNNNLALKFHVSYFSSNHRPICLITFAPPYKFCRPHAVYLNNDQYRFDPQLQEVILFRYRQWFYFPLDSLIFCFSIILKHGSSGIGRGLWGLDGVGSG
jgi:hypothetical protein